MSAPASNPVAPSRDQDVDAPRPTGAGSDATTLLSVYVALLLLVPTAWVFGPLGGAGSPAQLFSYVLLLLWVTTYLRQRHAHGRPSVLVLFLFVFLSAVLVSFAVAQSRPINGAESSVVYLSIVTLAGMTGVYLVAATGLPDLGRLERLARRIVFFGAILATLGIAQWLTKQSLIDTISIPGLAQNRDQFGVGLREGFSRPAGTATHPLEFGLVIAMLVPLALHFALEDRSRSALRRWYPALAVLIMIPLSLSRSTLIGAGAAGAILLVSWSPRRRLLAAGATATAAVAVFVLVPGLSGSLLGLFTSISGDSSVSSRTGSYGLAWEFVTRNPFFGRGYGSFLPAYRILDNQFLGMLIDIGLVGLIAFVALLVASIRRTLTARARVESVRQRSLGTAIAASVAAGACGFLTFDVMSFLMSAGFVFLLLGMAAAYDGLAGRQEAVLPTRPLAATRSTIALALIGLLVTAGLAAKVYTTPGQYLARSYVTLVIPPTAAKENPLVETTAGLIATAGVLVRDLDPGLADGVVSGDVTLLDLGITQGTLVRQRNLGGQWARNYVDPVVEIQVVDRDQSAARTGMAEAVERLEADLASRQAQLGVVPESRIRTIVNPAQPNVVYVSGSRARATGLVVVLGLAGTTILLLGWPSIVRAWSHRRRGTA